MQQTALQFEFQSNQSFANFYTGSNQELIGHLLAMLTADGEQQIFIWGEAGTGKTHLLQALCQQARLSGLSSFYLDFAGSTVPAAAILEGMEDIELVCLDNIHQLPDTQEWLHGLFAFYNRHRQNNHRLVLAADTPPKYLPWGLMDLKTRMAWGLTSKIKALRDDQLIAAFRLKARDLGMDVPENVGRFLLNHFGQHQSALWQLLSTIDQATLIEKRRLTIPFIKQILQTEQSDANKKPG